jgi:hypothetical protein
MAGIEGKSDELPASQRGLLRANSWGPPAMWTIFAIFALLDAAAFANVLFGGKSSELRGIVLFTGFALFFGRGAVVGLEVKDGGVRVRLMFWTYRWRWDEIERFDLRGTVYTPSLRVTLKDGTERGIVGLAARTRGEKERAERIFTELNRRLEIEHNRAAV